MSFAGWEFCTNLDKIILNNHYPKTIKTSFQPILFVIVNLPSLKETNTTVDESTPHKVYNRPRTSPANKEPF